jgi:hypothetical protein
MMTALKNIASVSLIIVFLACMAITPACKPYRCPANGGSYYDKDPDRVTKARRHKPDSGLWPKNMKH